MKVHICTDQGELLDSAQLDDSECIADPRAVQRFAIDVESMIKTEAGAMALRAAGTTSACARRIECVLQRGHEGKCSPSQFERATPVHPRGNLGD